MDFQKTKKKKLEDEMLYTSPHYALEKGGGPARENKPPFNEKGTTLTHLA